MKLLAASMLFFALFPFLFSFLLGHWLFLRTLSHAQLIHAIRELPRQGIKLAVGFDYVTDMDDRKLFRKRK